MSLETALAVIDGHGDRPDFFRWSEVRVIARCIERSAKAAKFRPVWCSLLLRQWTSLESASPEDISLDLEEYVRLTEVFDEKTSHEIVSYAREEEDPAEWAWNDDFGWVQCGLREGPRYYDPVENPSSVENIDKLKVIRSFLGAVYKDVGLEYSEDEA